MDVSLNTNKCITKTASNKAFKANTENKPANQAQIEQKDPTEALKSQLGVKAPLPYNHIATIKVPYSNNAELYKLSNGQKVIILKKKGPTVIKTYVNTGSMNEPDNLRGISHYLEHNLFNGTDILGPGEFFKRTNAMGAQTNASTNFSQTDYYISSQMFSPNDLQDKIKLHADMLQNPKFAIEQLEKEKGPVISEISMVTDVPELLAVNECIKNLFQIPTTSADLVAGTINNIKSVKKEDIVNYYNTNYTPDNMVTVVTGEVDAQQAIELVAKNFTKPAPLKNPERIFENLTPINAPKRTDLKSDKATGSTVVMGFAGAENSNAKDKITSDIMLSIFNRYYLSKSLENLHTQASINIERIGNKSTDKQAIVLAAQISPDKTEDVIKTIYDEISKFKNSKINEKHLEIIKNNSDMALCGVSENSELLNSFIGTSLLDNNFEQISNYQNIVNSITTKDIEDCAKKYLNLNKVSLSVLHPKNVSNEQIIRNYSKSNSSRVVSFGAHSAGKKVIDTEKLTHYKLSNNLEFTLNPNTSDLTSFALSLSTDAPADVKPGVAVILSKMLNRGTMNKNHDQFKDFMDENGLATGFGASESSITVSSNSKSKDLKQALALTKEVITMPRLTPEDFEWAKADLKQVLENAPKSADDELYAQLFPNLSSQQSTKQCLQTLESVTLQDVMGLYQYVLQNAQAKMAITTPKTDDALGNITNEFSGLQQFKPANFELFKTFTPIAENRVITQTEPRNQAEIVQAYKFKQTSNIEDKMKFELMNILLGGSTSSRLFNDLRESEKLAYRVRSNTSYIGDTGVMTLSIATTTENENDNFASYDNVKRSLNGFKKHVEKLKNELPTDEELEMAKLYFKTIMLNNTESSEAQTQDILGSKESPYGVEWNNIALDVIDKITPQDIQAAAQHVFAGNSITSILASENTINHFLSENQLPVTRA